MLTDFQIFCIAGKCMKFATKPIQHYPPHRMLLHYLWKLKMQNLCRYSAHMEENANKLLLDVVNLRCFKTVIEIISWLLVARLISCQWCCKCVSVISELSAVLLLYGCVCNSACLTMLTGWNRWQTSKCCSSSHCHTSRVSECL